MTDDVEIPEEKSEGELYNEERVKVLQDALRVDYIEKFDVYAQLLLVQKELATVTVKNNKLEQVNNLLSMNNKSLAKEIVELKGIANDLKEKMKKSRAELRKQKEIFSASEPYAVEEPEIKEKPKRKPRVKLKEEQ
tara:strand:+ start:858 stop:1265 length:408 start_codon:yes stop_codon:yes gene_type:complete